MVKINCFDIPKTFLRPHMFLNFRNKKVNHNLNSMINTGTWPHQLLQYSTSYLTHLILNIRWKQKISGGPVARTAYVKRNKWTFLSFEILLFHNSNLINSKFFFFVKEWTNVSSQWFINAGVITRSEFLLCTGDKKKEHIQAVFTDFLIL